MVSVPLTTEFLYGETTCVKWEHVNYGHLIEVPLKIIMLVVHDIFSYILERVPVKSSCIFIAHKC